MAKHKKSKMIDYEEVAKQWRKDPAYVAAYEALAPEYALYEALIKARMEAGITQKELARRMGTSEAAVSRMMGANRERLPSWNTIMKFARAVGKKPVLAFVD